MKSRLTKKEIGDYQDLIVLILKQQESVPTIGHKSEHILLILFLYSFYPCLSLPLGLVILRTTVNCMSSGRLRGRFLSNHYAV